MKDIIDVVWKTGRREGLKKYLVGLIGLEVEYDEDGEIAGFHPGLECITDLVIELGGYK
jgi:hypothetical protein